MIRLPAPGSASRSQSDQSRLDSSPTGWGARKPHPGPLQPSTPLFLKNPRRLSNHNGVVFSFFPGLPIINLLLKDATLLELQGWESQMDFMLEILLRRLNIKRGGAAGTKARCPFRSCVSRIQVFSGEPSWGSPRLRVSLLLRV